MNTITFNPKPGTHICSVKKRKNTIIFFCPHCDYVRKINTKSNKMTSNARPDHVPHCGAYLAPGVDCFNSSNN